MNAVLQSSWQAQPAAEGAGEIDIRGLRIELGTGAQRFVALEGIDLSIQPGEFVCLLGPSGCGKSTLLGALAGHLQPAGGQALLDGAPIDGPDPRRGLVFQHHTLFPWLKVEDNVAYGLKMQGVPRPVRLEQARAMLSEVGLAGFEQRYPHTLSGGMQQRVEIARVLINRPRVLLMDEPFGALDALTRLKMQELLLNLWSHWRTTVVFVTHDIDEALFLADRIVVMSPRPGRIVEELHVPAERPRRQDWLTSSTFSALKRRCLALLSDTGGALPLERLDPVKGLKT